MEATGRSPSTEPGTSAGRVSSIEAAGIETRLVATYRAMARNNGDLLDLIVELEASEAHLGSFQDVAGWLRWNLGMSRRTGLRWVRIARALADLPILRQAVRSARVSLDQVELLLRIATVDTQDDLLELAQRVADVEELRHEVKDLQDLERERETEDEPPAGHVNIWWHNDALHLEGTIPGADGVAVETALLRLASQAPRDEQTGLYRNLDVRIGEALVQMASESLADDRDHDRATIVVHIPAHDLVTQQGDGWDAASRIFSTAELARLACDSRLQPALHDADGITVGVGRTTSSIESWLRRLIEGRDQGCRFPGCARTRWLHGHHLIPWAAGGVTNLDNLISLCGFHHRLIHRDHWTITGHPNHRITFHNRWGEPHTPATSKFPDNWDDLSLETINSRATQRLSQLATANPP